MNRPTAPLGLVSVGTSLLAVAVAAVRPAPAQVAAPPAGAGPAAPAGPTTLPVSPIPGDLKAKFDPAKDTATVEGFIATCVKNLTSTNPGAQSRGREDLIAGASSINAPNAAFVNVYMTALKNALDPLAGDAKTPIRTRLEIAMIYARISSNCSNGNVGLDFAKQLDQPTQQLLNDPSEVVVLWGMKSASNVVAAFVKANQTNSPLVKDAIAKCVAAHAKFAPIAQEAYVGLTLNFPVWSAPATSAPAVIPQLQEAFAARLKTFQGPGLPSDPTSERIPAAFLTFQQVWKLQQPAAQKRSLQLVVDYVQLAAQQYAYATTKQEKDGLGEAMRYGARSIQVAMEPQANSPLATALTQLGRFNTNTNSPQEAASWAAAMVSALQPQGIEAAPPVAPPPAPANPAGPVATPAVAPSSAAPAAMTSPGAANAAAASPK